MKRMLEGLKQATRTKWTFVLLAVGLAALLWLSSLGGSWATPSTKAQGTIPCLGTIWPSSGGASAGTLVWFTTTWCHSGGWQELKWCMFHVGATKAQAHNVFLCYNVQSNKLMIRNNDGTKWWGGYAPGSAHIMQNNQALVDCSQVIVEHPGPNWVKVTWPIRFKSAFRGQKNTYLKAKDKWNQVTAMLKKGTWLIY